MTCKTRSAGNSWFRDSFGKPRPLSNGCSASHYKQKMATAEATSVSTDSLNGIPDNISVTYLPDHTKLSQKAQQKGLNYYTQGYIHEIAVCILNESTTRVDAKCWRSMRKSEVPHRLQIEVNSNDEKLTESHCSCIAGTDGHCSHIVGLLKSLQGLKLHNFTSVPQQQSCTSVPQQWNVPRGPKIKPVPINHVVVARPLEQRKRKPIICHVDENYPIPTVTEVELQNLAEVVGSPLQYILSSSRSNIPTTSTPFGEVPIGSSLSYQTRNLKAALPPTTSSGCGNMSVHRQSPVVLPEEYKFLNRPMEQDHIKEIERNTIGQTQSDTWFQERKVRLTTSNFGKVLNRKAKPTTPFLEDVFNRIKKSAPALDYGTTHEKQAKAKYLETFPSRHIHDCGFVINNDFNFLGASPDGKVCDNGESGILEVKCPYSARNMDIEKACDEISGFCLERKHNDMSLKKNHMYYAQIQGQLMISGCDFCEFVIFTQRSLYVERIFPDVPFMENMLSKLSSFMKQYGQQYMV